MALLAWVNSEKVFLKIQEGTGDNLSPEDIEDGATDYVLWSTFRPESLVIDEELNMELEDSGMILLTRHVPARKAVKRCYLQAFGKRMKEGDVQILVEGD